MAQITTSLLCCCLLFVILDNTDGWKAGIVETKVESALTTRGRRSITSTRLNHASVHPLLNEVDIEDNAHGICYLRVGAFQRHGGKLVPTDGAEITVEVQNGRKQFVGYVRAVTGSRGFACVPTWCFSTALIQASYAEIPLTPAKTTFQNPLYSRTVVAKGKNVSLIRTEVLAGSKGGPVFGVGKGSLCNTAVASGVSAFVFVGPNIKKLLKQEGLKVISDYPPGNTLSWYPDENIGSEYNDEVCLLKVRIRGNRQVPIMLESFTGDETYRYGYVIKSPDSVEEDNDLMVACLEFRCNSLFPGSERTNRSYIIVSLLTSQCYYAAFSRELAKAQLWQIPWDHFDANTQGLYVPDRGEVSHASGFYFGGKLSAEQQCKRGKGSRISSSGYAVEFFKGEECPPFIDGNLPGLD